MRGAARCSTDGRGARDSSSPLSVHSQLLCPSTQSLPRSLVQLPRLSFPPSLLHSQERSVGVGLPLRCQPAAAMASSPSSRAKGQLNARRLFRRSRTRGSFSPKSRLLFAARSGSNCSSSPLRAISLYEESGLERVGEEGGGSRPGPLR